MKKRIKISTLLFGIIVALVALSNSRLYANDIENNQATELKTEQVEMFNIIQQILEKSEFVVEENECMKIYNKNNQLVYECRDKDDQRLKILLRRSDLVLQTDSSSYYLLGD